MPGTRKLGRTTAQRTAMLRAMVTFLLENGKIETTLTRAKEVQAMAEKMITTAKEDTLHNRRLVLAFVTKEDVTSKLFKEIAPNTAIETVAIQELLKSVPVVVTPLKWQLSSSFNSFKLIQVQFNSRLFSREFLRLFQNVGSFTTPTFIIELQKFISRRTRFGAALKLYE